MSAVELLLVDDSPADRAAFRIAMERTGLPLRLHFAASGREALMRLRGDPSAGRQLRPSLCLVDVKMPGMSGIELLAAMKQDPDLSVIPVMMLSGSDDPADVDAAYRLSASGYIAKPGDGAAMQAVADVFGRMCAQVLRFPSR